MVVEIIPYEGIKINDIEIKFGITQEELNAILGEAAKIEIDNIRRETREQRNGMTFSFIGDKLQNISISRHVKLFYKDVDIFNSENTLDLLSKYAEYEASKEKKNGYGNFYDLGLSLGGFGDRKIPEKKLAFVFSKDRIRFFKALLTV